MEKKDEIRLNTVKRFDPHVTQIVNSAARTALYCFDEETETWKKTEVEGTLLVYSREVQPHNMIIIINRLNKSDFREPLTPPCDIQVHSPFILFRNIKGLIFGIWFSCNDNVHSISVSIREKINENTQPVPQPCTGMTAPTSGVGESGGDILLMLSRAHGEYESKRPKEAPPSCLVTSAAQDLVKPSPLRAGETTTANVADFFAKVNLRGGSSGGLSGPSPSALPPAVSTAGGATEQVLQKLFQGAAAVGGQAMAAVTVGSAPIPIAGAHAPLSIPPVAPMMLHELEGKLKENLNITPSKEELTHPKPSSLLSPQVFTSNFPEGDGTQLDPSGSVGSLPPTLFSPGSSLSMEAKPLNGSRESLQDGPTQPFQPNITPLTHQQLVQAFTILLKKHDFVQQLHEAYIQALNQSLKGCL